MQVKTLLKNSENALLSASKLWEKDIYELGTLDLKVFLRTHHATNLANRAKREVESLIDIAWNYAITQGFSGEKMPEIVFFELPKVNITVDEFNAMLAQVSLPRRRAILFALESGLDIKKVIELTWPMLHTTQGLSNFAMTVANAMPRHLRLSYVFWEVAENSIVAPLLSLNESALEVAQGVGLDALRRLYRSMLPFDAEADRVSFIDAIVEEGRPKVMH